MSRRPLKSKGGDAGAGDVVLHHLPAESLEIEVSDLGLTWPPGVFSLSHVALPFPASDPLYGDGSGNAGGGPATGLGRLALRGENKVLLISPAAMLRQRWNPFHSYQQERMIEFVGLE